MRMSKKEPRNKKQKKLEGTIEDYPLVEVKWYDATGDSGWSKKKCEKQKLLNIKFQKAY